MLQVVFVNTENSEKIEKYRPYDYADAVILTENIEKECRKEKVRFAAEFHIVNDGQQYYTGVFNFGSYDYQNLYHQVRDKVPTIKTKKENEQHRLFVLEENENLTPAAYKNIEVVDKTFINLEKTNVSKLKKPQRLLIYAVAVLMSAASIFLFLQTQSITNTYEQKLKMETEKASIYDQLVEQYEQSLLGNRADLIPFLEGLQVVNKLTETQQTLLISEYLLHDEFEKAVALNSDTILLETMLLSHTLLSNGEKAKKIEAFNDLYPTNEARFDLAYFEKNYDLMLNIENVNVTVQRSEMKTYAYLKLGKLEEAKKELNNNSNAELEEKIVRYEVLQAEIKTLEDRKLAASTEELANIEKQISEKQAVINGL